MDVNTAALIASQAHKGQMYGTRGPYLTVHVQDVVARVLKDPRCTADVQVVAWLHDVLEDTAYTLPQLVEQGLTKYQQAGLVAITRKPEEPYGTYIGRICGMPLAVLVKYHDLKSNLSKDPNSVLLAKYNVAVAKIGDELDRLSGVAKCKACHKPIVFLKSSQGKDIPVDRSSLPECFSSRMLYDAKAGHIAHFATCPQAEQFRRRPS